MKTEIIPATHPSAIPHTIDVLKHGGLVAFPTDTVYGLAVLPTSEEAIDQLYIAKSRNTGKAIAILIGDFDSMNEVASKLTPSANILMRTFWPGPLTIIVPRHASLPNNIAQTPTVGVRMPDHPVALSLLKSAGPLAVTSANISGQPNPMTAADVLEQLEGRIHLIVDGGKTPGGVPSTVVDCTGDEIKILRSGPITMDQLIHALR